MVDFLEYTNSLEFDSVPDYDRCRKMFRDALVAEKHPLDGKLDFTAPKLKLKQKVLLFLRVVVVKRPLQQLGIQVKRKLI